MIFHLILKRRWLMVIMLIRNEKEKKVQVFKTTTCNCINDELAPICDLFRMWWTKKNHFWVSIDKRSISLTSWFLNEAQKFIRIVSKLVIKSTFVSIQFSNAMPVWIISVIIECYNELSWDCFDYFIKVFFVEIFLADRSW